METFSLQESLTIVGTAVLVAGLFAIGLFLLVRKLMLWYWKINELVETQKRTVELLVSIRERLPRQSLPE